MELNQDMTFKGLLWSGAQTRDCFYENCSFESCDFSDSVFSFCKFVDCVFTSCNMSMTKLTGCLLNNITFNNCKLLGVNFSDCSDSLFTVKFESCLLDYCSFAKKRMIKTSIDGSSAKNVDFSETDLTGSSFGSTDLLNSVFYRTILSGADFVTASNFNIDPEINNITRAKFSVYGAVALLSKYNLEIE